QTIEDYYQNIFGEPLVVTTRISLVNHWGSLLEHLGRSLQKGSCSIQKPINILGYIVSTSMISTKTKFSTSWLIANLA
ncbi:10717_t:CDS:1, partial [Dentiscutata heterogama]